MKKIWINLFAAVCLIISGCISVSDSPRSRFYMLQPADESQITKKNNIGSDVLIGIGPINIPEYLFRPQMVTRDKDKMLKFAQFDRWGETLDIGISRLFRENLTVMLPGAKYTLYPWNSSVQVKYQVVVEIIQLDSELNKNLIFVAQWLVIDGQSSKTLIMKRSEFQKPIAPQDYFGLAKTLSEVCASLSNEIAEALSALKSNKNTKVASPAPEQMKQNNEVKR